MSSSYCTQCGASLVAGTAFCSNCGAITGNAPPSQVPATVPSARPTATYGATPSGGYAPSPTAGYGAPAAARAYSASPAIPRPAGFWIRFVAVIIDYICIQIISLPVGLIIGIFIGFIGAASHSDTSALQALSGFLGFGVGTLAAWLYEAWFTSSTKQATLGKLALGLKVIGEDGQRISFARATGRHFAQYISALIMCIGYIMAAFTDRKRALHDIMAGTYVVYKD